MTQFSHNESIIDQFSKQAAHWSEMPVHSHESALNLMVAMTNANRTDSVLDVACGPGLVSEAFAPKVKHFTGIDLTPAMVHQARQLASRKCLQNVSFEIGDVTRLPYADQTFSIVVTRYSVHHFLDPKQVLREMHRVCRTNGVVLVVDSVMPPEKREFYDSVEQLRDPSHVKTLTLGELRELATELPLQDIECRFYKWEMQLEILLKASFANPDDEETIRREFINDVGKDRLGLGVRKEDHDLCFAYPIVILKGIKKAATPSDASATQAG